MEKIGQRFINHNFYSKAVEDSAAGTVKDERPRIGLSLVIDRTTATDQQLLKLLDILDRAAQDANAVMGW